MTSPDEFPPEPANLRLLRRLVTTLTVVFIVAVIAIVGLLVIRLGAVTPPPVLPDAITAPAGERITATTLGTGWSAIVTTDAERTERIHILNPDGTIRQTVTID